LLPYMPDTLKSSDMACYSNYHHDPTQEIEYEYLVRVYKVHHRCCHYKQKPVCPTHYASVVPAKLQGLSLGAEITGDKHAHYGNDTYLPLYMACEKDTANDYDVSVAVNYVIDEISLWASGLEVSSHETIDSIKHRVKRYHKSTGKH